MEAALLKERDLSRFAEKVAFGQLWNIEATQSGCKRFSQGFKLLEASLNLKITIHVKGSHSKVYLSVKIDWVANKDTCKSLLVFARHHRLVEYDTIVLADLACLGAFLHLLDQPRVFPSVLLL